ncbi:hypothetical protein HPP92_021226 [Vanilla planifolia]|uniref:RRM domain-containing protein n=1 Tax=Vanilla planifolia TaxID=51239 RepID=A0A835UFB8_VANPL|nr:hypothetical protein HPP92_021226 [Vanilla planifolia]
MSDLGAAERRRMESDLGKLFIGGISWETTEDRLREYFKKFGDVVEVIIMRDRTTGRGRGFGFVLFADHAVAERVIMEKHLIDGRMVEAKKAVPRDDQHILNRSNGSSIQGSPTPGRTKKIFVGGLASTVTEAEFKKYFELFGNITDVVVMYDHNTQRPRGFGFITFDAEDAVEKVLRKSFHELNGKMVEVKRAIPKELNIRSPIGGYCYSLNRINSLVNGYSPTQGYNPNSISSCGMRVDGRFGTLASPLKSVSAFGSAYGIGINFEPGMNPSYGRNSSFNSSFGYGRTLSPYHTRNSSRFVSHIGYSGISVNPGSTFSTTTRSLWGNGDLNYNANLSDSNSNMTTGGASLRAFSNSGLNWIGSSSPLAAQGLGSGSGFISGTLNYGSGENSFSLISGNYGVSSDTGSASNNIVSASNSFEENFSDSMGSCSIFGNHTWESVSSDLESSSPLGYGLGASETDVSSKGGSTGYIGAYNVSNRQINRSVTA